MLCVLQAFKLAVGRSYRLVDRLDVVPALPRFDGYVHIDYSQWIQVMLSYILHPFVCGNSHSGVHAQSMCRIDCMLWHTCHTQ